MTLEKNEITTFDGFQKNYVLLPLLITRALTLVFIKNCNGFAAVTVTVLEMLLRQGSVATAVIDDYKVIKSK